jgi:hypothetical protein
MEYCVVAHFLIWSLQFFHHANRFGKTQASDDVPVYISFRNIVPILCCSNSKLFSKIIKFCVPSSIRKVKRVISFPCPIRPQYQMIVVKSHQCFLYLHNFVFATYNIIIIIDLICLIIEIRKCKQSFTFLFNRKRKIFFFI